MLAWCSAVNNDDARLIASVVAISDTLSIYIYKVYAIFDKD